jgi:hypothetical protein
MFCDFKEVLGENVLFFLKTRQKLLLILEQKTRHQTMGKQKPVYNLAI